MKLLTKVISAATLALAVGVSYASPAKLITHNKTNVESNAIIGGHASTHPTKPNKDRAVPWIHVRLVCHGYVVNNKCSAVIRMGTDTSHPVDVGTATVDLDSGYITFIYADEKNSDYVVTVNGPGETTITKK